MKTNIIALVVSMIVFALLIISCAKMDDYKDKFLGDNLVINYTGKIDSLKIYAGEYRVMVEGVMVSDPKIVEARIFWNNRRDSIVVPVSRTSGVDTLRQMVDGLEEGIYNFEVITYDNLGNKSVAVNKTGRVFGEMYRRGMVNAPLLRSVWRYFENGLECVFANIDPRTGIFATEVRYLDEDGQPKLRRIHEGERNPVVPNLTNVDQLSYRTLYVPDTLSVDTFYTEFTDFRATDTVYFRNLGNYNNRGYPQFEATNIRGRWGVISEWQSNAAANMIDNGQRGSWDSNTGVGVLAAEAGWGTPNINNGKIYQAQVLPAGRYRAEIDFVRNNVAQGDNNLVYFVATTETEIPNAVEVERNTANLAFLNMRYISDSYRTTFVEFENPVSQPVTIGFVVNFTSSANQFFNVRGIRVRQVNN